MTKNETSRLKLAGTYLIIIMTMSIVFSCILYNVSERELRGQRRIPVPMNNRFVDPVFQEFDLLREARLDQSRENLRNQLILSNFIALFIGAGISYLLAVRALKPIEENLENQARFASDASHELRTPLTAIRSEIEVALRDKKLTTKDAREILASNLEEVTKLEALTSGLLQLAQEENADRTLSELSLNKIVSDAIERVAPNAKKRNISIDQKTVKKDKLYGEPQSLIQLLVVLLDNAIKYSRPGSAVTVTGERNKTNAIVTIQDNGAGIDARDLPHIFDRFYRSDKARTKSSSNGYGLGLAIAKQIADFHGGSIDIESAVDIGTTARLTLPQKPL